jgi:GntR family transcriptional regulator, arabinose operon transcriptional repressor
MEDPKYLQIYHAVAARITEGFWQPGDKIYSERQLAVVHNVSRLTVKRALTKLIADGVLEYREGKQGTFVAEQQVPEAPEVVKTRTIGVAVDNHTPAFASYLLQGIHDALWDKGYHPIYCNTYAQNQQIDEKIDSLIDAGISGIIFSPMIGTQYYQTNVRIIDQLARRKIPVVLVDRFVEDRTLSHIVTNDREAMRELTRRLLDTGHRSMLIITGEEATSTRNRLKGIYDAYEMTGTDRSLARILPVPEKEFFETGMLEKQLYEQVAAMDDITAVIGLSPILLRAGMKLTRTLPQSITTASVAAGTAEAISDVTAIGPIYRMGLEAGNLLVRSIEDPTTPITQLILKAEIIPREQ